VPSFAGGATHKYSREAVGTAIKFRRESSRLAGLMISALDGPDGTLVRHDPSTGHEVIWTGWPVVYS